MELDMIVSDNKDYQDIIRQGIRSFNNKSHPDMEIFNLYREKCYNDPFGFYAILDNQIVGGIVARKKMQWIDNQIK